MYLSPNLTPIDVRGKRRSPSTPGSRVPRELQDRLREQHQLHRQQHLQSQQQNDGPPQKRVKRSLSEVMADRAIQDRPTLDSLPSEILEKILLYSTNLSLPHASTLIGIKLSERATLIRLFIQTFHDTWDQWFGIPTSKSLHRGPPVFGRRQNRVAGDPELQTAILRQPWAKIDLILVAQQTWADKYAQGRWFQHSIPWNEDPNLLGHSHHGGPCHFVARDCFEIDYQQALKWSPFRVESLPWGGQDIHPQANIPVELITGPWDDEKLRRLFWLTRGGMMPSHGMIGGPSWEDKIQFLRNAVLEATHPNTLAINCLMGAWIFQGLPADVVRTEANNIDRRLQWGDDNDDTRQILQRTRQAMHMFLDYRQARRSSV